MKALNRLSRGTLAWGSAVFAAIILLNVNFLAELAFPAARVDLTEDHRYTISDGTRAALAGIEEPVHLRVYFTRALGERYPRYGQHFDRVRTLLDQYVELAAGKLIVDYFDPEPFSAAEDRAMADGMRGVPIDEQGGLGYFGVIGTNSVDGRETIAFLDLDREQFLEYDLTAMIHSLARPDKAVVGLITGLGIDGSVDMQHGVVPPWRVMDQIRKFFDVETLVDINEIPSELEVVPDNIDVVLLVQPLGLSEKTVYALDQYVLGGGKVLLFADPTTSLAANIGYDEALKPLLEAWGVEIKQDKVAGDLANARKVQITSSGQPIFTEYVAWLSLAEDAIAADDVVAAGIEKLNVATAGVITTVPGAEDRVTPLVQTSEQSMELDVEDVPQNADAVALLRNFKPSGKRLTVAARISGPVSSAFPDGPPPSGEGEGEKAAAGPKRPHISSGDANVIVVADVDMLHDQFWVSVREFFGQKLLMPNASNSAFVVNALENLSGEPELIALRGRGLGDRPFELVQKIQLEAEKRYRDKEKALAEELEKVEARIAELEAAGAGSLVLSADDRRLVENFQRRTVEIRRDLREVKLALRHDIDALDTWLKTINIAGVPAVFAIVGVGLAGWRRARRGGRR